MFIYLSNMLLSYFVSIKYSLTGSFARKAMMTAILSRAAVSKKRKNPFFQNKKVKNASKMKKKVRIIKVVKQ